VEKCVKIQTGDEHHGEFVRNWKKRVDEMLQINSRDWRIIAENSSNYYYYTYKKKFFSFFFSFSFFKNKYFLEYEKRLLCNRDDLTSQSAILANSIYSHHHHNPLHHPNSQDQIDLAMKPKRRRGNLPKAVTALLKEWLAKHKKHPYPTEEEKLLLAKETKLSLQQISNWFINARRRHLPHLLESDSLSMNNQSPELDIYPYEATESAGNYSKK
jgi:hypothetical protein